VCIDDRAVTGLRPSRLNRLGVSRTFQPLQVFPQLSVRENLMLAGQEHGGSRLLRLFGARDAGLTADAERMLEYFRLGHLGEERALSLSHGQQKLLDCAMAVYGGPAARSPRQAGRWRQLPQRSERIGHASLLSLPMSLLAGPRPALLSSGGAREP